MEGSVQVSAADPIGTLRFQVDAENLGMENHDKNLGFQDSTAPAAASSSKPVLSDELRDNIIKQVEYYFTDENLPTDNFLMKYVKKDKEGFVPIAVIASFRKMKKLVQDISLVETALRESSLLVVSPDGKKVKRLLPFPDTDSGDTNSRTVLVENLSGDYSTANIERIFGNVGKIKNICIRDQQSVVQGSIKISKPERVLSSKLHALVEYETVEAAEKAVLTLNDERNWRSGMLVQLLRKRMGVQGKYGRMARGRKANAEENNVSESDIGDEKYNSKISESRDEKLGIEGEEHLPAERDGRNGRRRGQGRGHGQHNTNGHGHGHGSSLSSQSCEVFSKPLPGPRMPDGTRGFAMGRGRPPVSDASQHIE